MIPVIAVGGLSWRRARPLGRIAMQVYESAGRPLLFFR
ncbi:hypothetical protein BMAGB8_A0771 [Burkholderia mallei GB8 horse 4]|nr:hypothetical protein BMAGB8_A0771 [Burkholderia mallei GB8 horse 4]